MLEGYLESVINLDVIDTGFGALTIWNVSEIAIRLTHIVVKSSLLAAVWNNPRGIGDIGTPWILM